MDARQALIQEILYYESDTFSARRSNPRWDEAEVIADRLIHKWADAYLDGIAITGEIERLHESTGL